MTIDYSQAREMMVEQQVRPWDVLDARVLEVLATLPREDFVPQVHRTLAYADVEIPLGHGQKMMKPSTAKASQAPFPYSSSFATIGIVPSRN